MTWQVAYTARPLLPSWPCRPVGLPFLLPVALETAFPLLPVTPSLVAISLVPQPRPASHPLSVVHQRFLCLLEDFPIVSILLEWRAYLPYYFPVVVAAVSTTRSLPVVWPFDFFPHASPWPILPLTPLVVLPGGLCL